MDNAFYSGMQNARSFLMQPQLERERMQDRKRRISVEDLELERQRQAQAQAEAQARALAERQQREGGVYAEHFGLPARARQMGSVGTLGGLQPSPQPMQQPMQGAPIQQSPQSMQQPIQPQMSADGTPIVEVRGMRERMQQPSFDPVRAAPESELIDQLMMSAYQAGDQERFIALAGQRREMMSEEEKAGRQAIAGYASQILERVPRDQWPAAIRQAMAQLGIDPSQTRLDDITDPAQLEQALRLEIARGDPEAALRSANLPFERVDLGDRDAPFNPRTGTYGQPVARGIDPNNRLSAETQRRGQDVSAATARRGQDVSARVAAENRRSANERARIQASTSMTLQQRREAMQREGMRNQREIAAIRGGAGVQSGLELGDIENDPNWEVIE